MQWAPRLSLLPHGSCRMLSFSLHSLPETCGNPTLTAIGDSWQESSIVTQWLYIDSIFIACMQEPDTEIKVSLFRHGIAMHACGHFSVEFYYIPAETAVC